jgi:hypothetical protein
VSREETRKRLYEDFEYYAKHCLKLRSKPDKDTGVSKLSPFLLNRGQKRILENVEAQLKRRGFVRLILVKGRQMGSSTFVEGWLFWWTTQRKAQRTLVVAHDATATQTVFEMTKRFFDNCPEAIRPHKEYNSRKELSFDKLDSSYRIATAGGDGIVRGEMIQTAHLSEFAWWPPNSAKQNFSGLMDAIPNTRGTAVFIESTSNSYNLFYEQYEAARKGESLFEVVFLPWYWADEYQMPVGDDFELTPDETELMAKYGPDGLTHGHLVFRRAKIAEKGRDQFKQEFPFDAEESFLTSGHPVFNPERVQDLLEQKQEPIARKTLINRTWEDSPRGELHCFLPHDPTDTYYVGADVAHGVGKDWSVAQVFDSQRRQAAVWRSNRTDPDRFGTVLAELGRFYNEALVICEANNSGGGTANHVLAKAELYQKVFQETLYDKVTDTETLRYGFLTTEKSKSFVIDRLRANVRTKDIQIYDERTLLEMRSFIVTESGRMESERGTHDDHVIALALADHINEGVFQPILNEAGWYGEIE